MEFYITLISVALMIIGAFGIILLSKPLDKIIMLSILEGGFFLAVVTFKYLDVAFVIALLGPLSIITLLLPVIKINEIRKKKSLGEEYYD
ncbi:EhaD family protein [Methanobrevibacter sp. OttesenSCG-928-K11]|nr:EhaD family protein [Methanobrevibacter sp. OttesenSCG-928-K11]MDL2270791.1 EhaD family protein [Methanobrevibacter sp. OttesenSCG-928-I08]